MTFRPSQQKTEIQIRLPEETSLYRNQTKRHIFEILKSAQIEFDLKTAVYEVICKDTTILEKISELQGMNLDHDLQGAIMELLTASGRVVALKMKYRFK